MSALLEVSPDALVRYYSTSIEFASLCEKFRKNNTLIKEGIDILTGYPAIIVNDNGRLVFYRASEHFRIFELARLTEIVPEPSYILPASNITIDKENVRSGDIVTIFVTIYETRWNNISLRIENPDAESETVLKSGSVLEKGKTEFIWKATKNGTYQVRLKGFANGTWREIVSSFHIDVIDTDKYLAGTLSVNGNEMGLYATGEIARFDFSDAAEFIIARKKAMHEAIYNSRQYTCVILKDTTAPSSNNGVVRLMHVQKKIYSSVIKYDGASRVGLPPYSEEQRLRAHGITIDRIVTSDSLQLIPDGIIYRYCCESGDLVFLDEADLILYNAIGRINPVAENTSGLYRTEELRIEVNPTLSDYLQVITALRLGGHFFRSGSYSDGIAVYVHPVTFHQKYVWILFRMAPDARPAKDALELIFNQGNSAMCIVAPLLSTAAMTNQDGSFESFIDVPGAVSDSCGDLKKFMEDNIHLYKPSNPLQPFANTVFADLLDPNALIVQSMEHITSNEDGYFFTGSAVSKNDQADYSLDPSEENATLQKTFFPFSARNPFFIDKETREYSKNAYYRNYPGLLYQCKKMYRVRFSFAQKPDPGLYLLVVKNTRDHRVHPVRIFESSKTGYCFCHLTDLHLASRYDEIEKMLSGHDRNAYVNPSAVIRKVATEVNKADFVVITGDAIDFVNEHRPWEPDFVPDGNWRYLERLIRECFSVPVFICPGNHDYRANPFPAKQYKDDLNISGEALDRYPHDKIMNEKGWARNDCNGDVFFGDANSLQYYHYNFCPFSFFSFSLHNLDFVFVDSQADQVVFLNDYITREPRLGLDLLIKLLSVNPPPQSSGISDQAFAFINNSIKNTGVLFMHSAIFNPTINWPDPLCYEDNLSKLEGWNKPYLPNPDKDKSILMSSKRSLQNEHSRLDGEILKYESTNMSAVTIPFNLLSRANEVNHMLANIEFLLNADKNFNEACITNNKEKIISLFKEKTSVGGRLKMIVSGHVHKNLELKYKNTDEGYRWHMGNYSRDSEKNSLPLENTTYSIATISGSVVGYQWRKRRPDIFSMSKDMFFMEYHAVGYRMVKFKADGSLTSMNVTEINKDSI